MVGGKALSADVFVGIERLPPRVVIVGARPSGIVAGVESPALIEVACLCRIVRESSRELQGLQKNKREKKAGKTHRFESLLPEALIGNPPVTFR